MRKSVSRSSIELELPRLTLGIAAIEESGRVLTSWKILRIRRLLALSAVRVPRGHSASIDAYRSNKRNELAQSSHFRRIERPGLARALHFSWKFVIPGSLGMGALLWAIFLQEEFLEASVSVVRFILISITVLCGLGVAWTVYNGFGGQTTVGGTRDMRYKGNRAGSFGCLGFFVALGAGLLSFWGWRALDGAKEWFGTDEAAIRMASARFVTVVIVASVVGLGIVFRLLMSAISRTPIRYDNMEHLPPYVPFYAQLWDAVVFFIKPAILLAQFVERGVVRLRYRFGHSR